MQTIYKYSLDNCPGRTTLSLSRGARILHIGKDSYGTFCAWALIDNTSSDLVPCTIAIIGTGWDMSGVHDMSTYAYHSTFLDHVYVWHAFVKMESE